MDSATASDEQLWRLACEGGREAFAKTVERYQSLVCSLAYSACGALGTCEDMAQETFITAWHRLKELREPSNLRPWLCGIVRNIAASAVRRHLRRGGQPESLDLADGGLGLESWPNIRLTHLWFLYYLAIITALFLAARWMIGRSLSRLAVNDLTFSSSSYRRVISGRWFPLLLAIFTTPLLAFMRGPGVETPDQSLSWNFPVLALYGCYFTLGWWLHRPGGGLLDGRVWPWKSLLMLGVVISLPASISVRVQYAGGAWVTERAAAFKWACSFATSLTMALSVLGWLGCFVRFFTRPSDRIRYVADVSYWIYLAHLPLVVALQIGCAKWALPWWVQLPMLNVVAFAILLLSYHAFIRLTWLGAWLNGRRTKRPDEVRGLVPWQSEKSA